MTSRIVIDVRPALAPFLDRLTTKLLVLEQDLLPASGRHLQKVLPAGRWLIVADAITESIAGLQVAESFRQNNQPFDIFRIEPSKGEKVPVADDTKIDHLADFLRSAPKPYAAVVAIGAGTINDIVKMAVYQVGLPYAVVGTAPSMNGYTSGIAAILSKGVKTTQPCTPPVACLIDLDIMAQAPYRMIASGLGDLISKPVSNADWRLAYRLVDAFYSPDAMILVEAGHKLLDGIAHLLPQRDVEAVGKLSASLCLSGLAMSVAGSSSPASGGEHLISHYIDMTHFAWGESHDFHGCQVGVGTITTAAMYEALALLQPETIDIEARVQALLPWPEYAEILKKRFGSLAPAVLEFAEKGYPSKDAIRSRLQRLKKEWNEILSDVRQTLRSADDIQSELLSAQCPVTFADIDVPAERARRAVLHCKDIRPRYTILHLAFELGWLESWTDHILHRYHGISL